MLRLLLFLLNVNLSLCTESGQKLSARVRFSEENVETSTSSTRTRPILRSSTTKSISESSQLNSPSLDEVAHYIYTEQLTLPQSLESNRIFMRLFWEGEKEQWYLMFPTNRRNFNLFLLSQEFLILDDFARQIVSMSKAVHRKSVHSVFLASVQNVFNTLELRALFAACSFMAHIFEAVEFVKELVDKDSVEAARYFIKWYNVINPAVTLLGSAVIAEDLNAIRNILKADLDEFRRTDLDGLTAAHHAASLGHVHILYLMFYMGTDLNYKSYRFIDEELVLSSAIIGALEWKNRAVVNFLLNLKKETSDEYAVDRESIEDVAFEAIRLNLTDHLIAMLFSGRVHPNARRNRYTMYSYATKLGRLELSNIIAQSFDHVSRLFEKNDSKGG